MSQLQGNHSTYNMDLESRWLRLPSGQAALASCARVVTLHSHLLIETQVLFNTLVCHIGSGQQSSGSLTGAHAYQHLPPQPLPSMTSACFRHTPV